jgi:hypothetical protein
MKEQSPGRAMLIEDACAAILAGEDPGVQGAAIASLLACWLAGHEPEIRDRLIEAHIRAVREMVPLYDKRRPQ